MILFISNSGESLPVAYRIIQGGGQAIVYIHNSTYRSNYEGLVPRVTASKLPGIVQRADAVVFDIIRPNEQSSADQLLLKVFRCKRNAPEVFGAVAEKIKSKTLVIGASSETATWELDREKGGELAEKAGLQTPESQHFNALSKGAKFLQGKRSRWVFKPHNNQDLDLTYVESYSGELQSKLVGEYKERLGDQFGFVLQQVIEGVEISTEGWFDGEKFAHFNHTIEDKKLMTGNLGPSIGSQGNTVWVKRKEGLLMPELRSLAPKLKEAGYVGPVDCNCVVSEADKKPYFLEWTMRQGYDALYCLLELLQGKIAEFYRSKFSEAFTAGYVSSQRITIPPFPYAKPSLLKEYAQGVELQSGLTPSFWAEDVKQNDKRLECSGADGIMGVITGKGSNLGGSVGNMYRNIDKLKIASTLQHRTDGGKRCEKARNKLKKWGVEID